MVCVSLVNMTNLLHVLKVYIENINLLPDVQIVTPGLLDDDISGGGSLP